MNNDLISRQVAIDALWAERMKLSEEMERNLETCSFALRADNKARRNRVEEDIEIIKQLPPAQPAELDTLIKALEQEHKKLLEMQKALKNVPDTNVGDTISRQAAIADAQSWVAVNGFEKKMQNEVIEWLKEFPPAQPTQLTDDDIETIRIHLSAFKEKLCNQHRWNEAKEYEALIDRLTALPELRKEILYRHYKGGTYELVCNNVTHTETGESLVIYRDYRGKLWARPESMFYGLVKVGDDLMPRFVLCQSEGDAE